MGLSCPNIWNWMEQCGISPFPWSSGLLYHNPRMVSIFHSLFFNPIEYIYFFKCKIRVFYFPGCNKSAQRCGLRKVRNKYIQSCVYINKLHENSPIFFIRYTSVRFPYSYIVFTLLICLTSCMLWFDGYGLFLFVLVCVNVMFELWGLGDEHNITLFWGLPFGV